MLDDLILSIGSMIFTTILMIVYFSKKRYTSIQNKLYHILLVITYVLLITEIVTNLFFDFNKVMLVNNLILRIHWSTRIMWFAILYFYGVCILKDLDYDNLTDLIKHNTRCLIGFILSIIFFIVKEYSVQKNIYNYCLCITICKLWKHK